MRRPLGFFPTPVVKLERLSALLGGPNILMKRDDQTGLALGGNKTRKLEFLIADALRKDCDTIITAGAAQSNHCRQTAAACALVGLECHLVLGGEQPENPNGNLFLDKLFDAQIHWGGVQRKGEGVNTVCELLKSKGKKTYIIPYGGSNELGSLGFVRASLELDSQLKEHEEEVQSVVVASSSGGTQAGLMVGLEMLSSETSVIGIGIDKLGVENHEFARMILDLTYSTANQLELDISYDLNDVEVRYEYLGRGYGVVGQPERNAIRTVAKTEGVLLDPVYTGRAMAGLIDMIKQGRFERGQTVLFWHTGGTPSLFSYTDDVLQY